MAQSPEPPFCLGVFMCEEEQVRLEFALGTEHGGFVRTGGCGVQQPLTIFLSGLSVTRHTRFSYYHYANCFLFFRRGTSCFWCSLSTGRGDFFGGEGQRLGPREDRLFILPQPPVPIMGWWRHFLAGVYVALASRRRCQSILLCVVACTGGGGGRRDRCDVAVVATIMPVVCCNSSCCLLN